MKHEKTQLNWQISALPRGRGWGPGNQRGCGWVANEPRVYGWGAHDQGGHGCAQSDQRRCGRCSPCIYRPESSPSLPVLENNGFVIFPQPPRELQSTPFVEHVYGHKSVISMFENPSNQLEGCLIRGKLRVKRAKIDSKNSGYFVSSADEQHPNNSNVGNMSFRNGCLFIPAPDLSQVVLFINLSGVRKNEVQTKNMLKYQIIHQLSYISETIIGPFDEKVLVHVLLNVKQSVKSNISSIAQTLVVVILQLRVIFLN